MHPRAVLRPRGTTDVALLTAWASEHGVALTPRGAGTGMPGGNVGPGVVLDLGDLDDLRPVDDGDAELDAGAGVVAAAAEALAARQGRTLPALPSSAPWCTLGAMAACNAAGARSFRFGSMARQVTGLEAVFADGSVVWLDGDRRGPAGPVIARLDEAAKVARSTPWPGVRKNSSGYALDRFVASGGVHQLLIGSEGTLAVVTRVRLRTEPMEPAVGVCLIGLQHVGQLGDALQAPAARDATACEYFGGALLAIGGAALGDRLSGIETGGGALLLEYRGDQTAVAAALREAEILGRSLGGRRAATEPAEIERLWNLRHDASPAIARAAGPGRRSLQFVEDSVVPVGVLPTYLGSIEEILARHDTPAVIFGHAGDGNLHVNPLVDVTSVGWRARVRAILEEVVALVSDLGGTLSGEHGDGRLRAPFLRRIWGDERVDAFAAVKRALDPAGVLNPGVVLPLPGQDPLEGFGVAPPHDPPAGVGAWVR